MKEYEIEFYSTKNGERPAEIFLNALDIKMLAKILRITDLLEEFGPELRLPYSKHLDDDIFEIRAQQKHDITRVLYFFVAGKKIILTNGFIKKTQKTTKTELERAKKYREDYKRRFGL